MPYIYRFYKLEPTYTVFITQEIEGGMVEYGFSSRATDIKNDFSFTAKECLSRLTLTEIARVAEDAYKLGYQHAVNDLRMIYSMRERS